jgi:hypothetical protein
MFQRRFQGVPPTAVAGAVVVLALLVAWYAGGRSPNPAFDPDDLGVIQRPIAAAPLPSTGFVGSRVCGECHAAIAAQFRNHPMARTLEVVESENVESATVDHVRPKRDATIRPPGIREYRVETTHEGMLHHEQARDRNGRLIYDQSMLVDYAIGSGRRGRSYLIDRDGWLSVSPVSWFANGGQWDLSPGYDSAEHPRFDRQAENRCLFCHSGRLNFSDRHSEKLESPPFLETAIGCERCHGPGDAHVKRHRSRMLGPETSDDPIINPASLAPALRESVCNQCHLQGDVEILRFGRAYRDFRPGQHIGQVWTTFVTGSGVAANQQTVAISHVQQMRESRCFQNSEGRLGCTACHDPHSVPTVAERIEFFRHRCLSCHAERGCQLPMDRRLAQENSCIDCHMSKLDASDVPHTAQTDHRILVRPDQTRTSQLVTNKTGQPNVFDERAYRLPEIEALRARVLLMAKGVELNPQPDSAQAAERELRRIMPAAPGDVRVLDALALMVAIQDRGPEAVKLWIQALDQPGDDGDDEVLLSLATYFETRRNWGQAAIYFRRLVERRPWEASTLGRYSLVLGNLGRLQDSLRIAREAVRQDPSNLRIHQWLSELHRRLGQGSESDHRLEILNRLRGRQ